MNPDLPRAPREQLEARLTALLLGELPAEEAAALRDIIAKDAQLAELQERLKRAMELVREVTATAAEPAPAPAAPLKLSDERRQKLLAHFKTVAPKEFVPHPRRREWSWIVPMSVAAVLVAMIGSFALFPGFSRRDMIIDHLGMESPPDSTAEMSQPIAARSLPGLVQNIEARKGGAPRTPSMDGSQTKEIVPQTSGIPTDAIVHSSSEPGATLAATPPTVMYYRYRPVPEEKQVAAKPLDPSESRPSPVQVRQKDVSTRSMPSKDEGKQETESLDVRRAGASPRQEIFLPPSDAQADAAKAQLEDSTFQSNVGGREFPLGSLLASSAGGRGGVFGGGGGAGGGIGGGDGAGFGPVGDAQADPNGWNAGRAAESSGNTGVSQMPAHSGTNRFVARYPFALQPPGVNGAVPALGLQPEKPANQPPANVEAKFFENSQTDNLALGFRYDRELERGRRMGVQSGAAPSPASQPSKAKPGIRDMDADDSILTPPGRADQEKSVEAGLAGAPRTVTTTSPERAVELNGFNERVPLARKRDGMDDLYAGQLPRLGDSPELGRIYRANPDATAGEARSKVERPATPQTEGKDFAKLSANKAGVVAAQDVELNGRLEQRVERLGETAIPLGVDAARQLDAAGKPINRDDAASFSMQAPAPLYYKLMMERYGIVPPGATPPAQPTERSETTANATSSSVKTTPPSEEAIGRKSPSIVLPSVTTDTAAGIPIVITDSAVRGYTPAATLEPETLRRLQSARGEAETEYSVLDSQLKQLKELPREELRKDFPKRISDATLTDLTRQLSMAEQNLASKSVSYGPDTAETKRLATQVQDLQKKIDDRINGVMAGLEMQAKTAKSSVNSLSQALEQAQKEEGDQPPTSRPVSPAAEPQPEVQTRDNAYSTFALNVSDVSFKLAGASLEKGVMPEPATVRSEEFINAFDYRDPEPPPGVPIAFAWERTHYPFAHNRDLLRFSVKTAAAGRQSGRSLNLVLLLDNSGSMERADRVQIIHEALRVLATQLQPQDRLSVVTFARTARLWVDGLAGNQAGAVAEQISSLTPQGGTNLGDAMDLAYQTALRHYLANGVNRIVLLTDGAANLGNVDPAALKQKVEAQRKQGIALDCFGIGWEGYNDDLLEILSRNGDGRYGFINTPEEAASDFAGQLAGALRVAASDVKVQVEFNPGRVTAYRQIGYAKHQLTKEQFRDNTVDAAEIGAAESGNALYVAEVNPRGEGPLAIVRVRYKVPGTADYREHEWAVPYARNVVSLEQASPGIRLAAVASGFSEWLVSSPYAAEITPDRLLGYLAGVPEFYGADPRPKKLEWMIRQAKAISGK